MFSFKQLSFKFWYFIWFVALPLALAWMAVVTPINIVFDVNYGYTGNRLPNGPTLMDHLGPWPWRIATLFLTAQAVCALIYLPWPIARRLRGAGVSPAK